jgi:hypothetical protein
MVSDLESQCLFYVCVSWVEIGHTNMNILAITV